MFSKKLRKTKEKLPKYPQFFHPLFSLWENWDSESLLVGEREREREREREKFGS